VFPRSEGPTRNTNIEEGLTYELVELRRPALELEDVVSSWEVPLAVVGRTSRGNRVIALWVMGYMGPVLIMALRAAQELGMGIHKE
jgi:hypothetical protein